MKKAQTTLRAYLRPEVEIFQVESQSVLAVSGNPTIINPPMEWGTQKKDYPWQKETEE